MRPAPVRVGPTTTDPVVGCSDSSIARVEEVYMVISFPCDSLRYAATESGDWLIAVYGIDEIGCDLVL